MEACRKQIAFDLDTKALEAYYPTENWRGAYRAIRKYMENCGFEWQQGSVYVSQKMLLDRNVDRILEKLVDKYPWLNVCMRDCQQTNIGKEHSLNFLFDKNADIMTRAEMEALEAEKYENNFEDEEYYEDDDLEL